MRDRFYLGYIEPKEPARTPIIDELTCMATFLWRHVLPPCPFDVWMGTHRCRCGARSTACDYVLDWTVIPDTQIVTNSLLVHYVACHRDECPAAMLDLIRKLFSDPERNLPEYVARYRSELCQPTAAETGARIGGRNG